LLEGEGCVVNEAANGSLALSALQGALPDLIILDLMMPVMNGWDFYGALQKDARLMTIPIAVMSGVSRLRPFGSMHVLHKPINLAGIIGLLDAIDAPNDPRGTAPLGPS
jgi:CheY-like chemotaxis protein